MHPEAVGDKKGHMCRTSVCRFVMRSCSTVIVFLQGSLLCASEYDVSAVTAEHNNFEGVKCEDIATLPSGRHYGSEFGEAAGTGGGAAFGSKLEFTRERDFFVSLLE